MPVARIATAAPGTTAAATRSRCCAGRIIAVIDDDATTLDAMQTLFETWGAIVVCGETLEALIDAIGALERYPDLIVADLRLGGERSGIDAVVELRRELGVDIPSIIVSGDTGSRAEREAQAARMKLLPKPVVGATLYASAVAEMSSGLATALDR